MVTLPSSTQGSCDQNVTTSFGSAKSVERDTNNNYHVKSIIFTDNSIYFYNEILEYRFGG